MLDIALAIVLLLTVGTATIYLPCLALYGSENADDRHARKKTKKKSRKEKKRLKSLAAG